MKRILSLSSRVLTTTAISALLAAAVLAQAGQQPARPSTKGAVLKGKAPVNKEILKVKLPRPAEMKLKNGLQVLILEDHKLPTFSMQMVILSGGMSNPPGQEGTAQYVATMLREGTKTRTSRQIAEQIDALGASLGANSSLSSVTSVVSASGLVENFDQIIDLFADVILNPSFPADEFTRLKTRGIAQLQFQRAQPGFLSGEMFSKVIYGAHPAGRFSLTAEQIQRFTPEMLAKFHATYYKPNNAIFAIVGDVKPAEVMAQLEKAFGSWQPGEVPKTEIPAVQATGPSKIYLIDRPGSVQTNLLLGVQSITRTDPDYFALEMMNQTLGGGASSRLFLNLREDKGYTYGAYSSVSSFKYPGTFRANSEVRTNVTKGSMDEFFHELNRIRDQKVEAEEFARAQRTIVGGWALQLEFPQSALQNAITQKIYNLPADYWDNYPQMIAAVTPDDIQRVARKYLDLGKLQIVAVGDAKQIAGVLGQFGTVEQFDTNGKPMTLSGPAASASTSTSVTGGDSIAINGTWKIIANSPQGEMPLTAVLRNEGGQISGTVESQLGQTPIVSGRVIGNEVSFKVKIDAQGNQLEINFSGTISGETMKGQVSSAAFPNIEFTGKKEK
jgi:predicted Zn-dependent peptidase